MYELIVLFAHWCPKCNMMMPIVEDMEKDYVGILHIQKIDVEEHPEAMEAYGIEIVPTFLIMHHKQEIGRMSGLIGEKILRGRIEAVVKE